MIIFADFSAKDGSSYKNFTQGGLFFFFSKTVDDCNSGSARSRTGMFGQMPPLLTDAQLL